MDVQVLHCTSGNLVYYKTRAWQYYRIRT